MIIDKGNIVTLATKSGRHVRVRLEVNPKARRLILRLDSRNGEAVGVAPRAHMLPELAAFASERADWLEAQLSALPETRKLVEGSLFSLRGVPCTLSATGHGRTARLDPGPPQRLIAPGDSGTLGRRALRFLRAEARTDLEAATERHARTLGITVGKVRVRDTRSRWGSCTSKGDLSYSWRLIMAPPHVLDYVAAHECAHRLEMNHSPSFWAHVEHCRPGWKRSRNWLRQNGASLHAVGA